VDDAVVEIRNGPLWVPEAKRVTIHDFLAQQLEKSDSEATCKADGDRAELKEDDARLEAVNTKVNRLQWMLEHTMGSQGDFERRRGELVDRQRGSDGNGPTGPVDDDAVLRSYLDSVHDESGTIREFLRLGALAFVAHKTLFVHGGIMSGAGPEADPVISFGRVPDEPDKRYDSVSEWVDKLNSWYQRGVDDWIRNPTWRYEDAGTATRGGNELLKYVLPDYPASVVMGRHLLPSGMPALLPPHVVDTLTSPSNGIERVIVGHTPHGNCPTFINHGVGEGHDGAPKLQVIMCDTSYSDTKAADNRGQAASDVVLHPDGTVSVHGVLEDGRLIAFDSHDQIIGRTLADGMQVKAKMADLERDEYLVYSVKNGYLYSYDHRAAEDLALAVESS
jgi:hypothetical protein